MFCLPWHCCNESFWMYGMFSGVVFACTQLPHVFLYTKQPDHLKNVINIIQPSVLSYMYAVLLLHADCIMFTTICLYIRTHAQSYTKYTNLRLAIGMRVYSGINCDTIEHFTKNDSHAQIKLLYSMIYMINKL